MYQSYCSAHPYDEIQTEMKEFGAAFYIHITFLFSALTSYVVGKVTVTGLEPRTT